MKALLKNCKKGISLLLAVTFIICAFSLPCSAALPDENDVIESCRWRTGPYYSKYYSIYEIILSPNYVRRADVVIYDKEHDDRELTENEEYTVHTEEIPDYGKCFVIDIVTNGISPYLKRDSFKDAMGRGNATIYLINNHHYTEKNVASFDKNINLGSNPITTDESLTVKFCTRGCVSLNGKTVAENVFTYTWEPDEAGEYNLTLSIHGLTVGAYTITVFEPYQVKENRIAELKSSLPETVLGFFGSIPIAILTLPTLPLILFGWIPAIMALGPIEYAGRFFDTLAEIRQLKSEI